MSKIEEVVIGSVGYTVNMGNCSTTPRPNEWQQQAILWGEGCPIQLRDEVLWDASTREPLLLFAVTPTKIFASARGDQWSQTRYQF